MPAVNKPVDGSFATTRSTLINIVYPTLEPRSAQSLPAISSLPEGIEDDGSDGTPPLISETPAVPPGDDAPDAEAEAEADEDDDDFIIMSEMQAKRIASLTNAAFDVDLSVDVVVAEPNVTALARRVMGAKSLRPGG